MHVIRPLFITLAILAMAVPADAQTSARGMYTKLMAREKTARRALASEQSPASVRRDVRRVVIGYEGIVRRYPRSGYCDNALWQGAMLSAESYARYRETEDRDKAMQLLRWLIDEYPTSSLVRRARPALNRLDKEAKPNRPVRASAPPTPSAPDADAGLAFRAPAPDTAAGTVAELRAIRRTVLPTVVRIAIELDRPVGYTGDTLGGPPRLFLDLHATRRSAMIPETIPLDDPLVTAVRFGPRPRGATRVVLDLGRAAATSVFTLPNPFRIIVDVSRGADAGPVAATSVVAGETVADAGALPPATPSPQRVAVPAPEAVRITPPLESPDAPLPARRAADGEAVLEAPPAPTPPSANLKGRFSLSRQLGLGVSRIVIDPGHGGHDPGTKGRGLNEADLVLDVALRLETLLLAEPGVEVVLTRRSDVFIDLEERTAIANREQADLFISIHANASRNRSAGGVETYFLNFASTEEAEAVAARENSASGQTMRNLPDIVKAIALNDKVDESRDFATLVQHSMVETLQQSNRALRDRGVKQAPFVVLIGASMPSVLAEISFITHAQEARLLKTPTYRQKIAAALFEGIQRYQRSLKQTVQTAANQDE